MGLEQMLPELYKALALPPMPAHISALMEHGVAEAGTFVVEQGRIVSMDSVCLDNVIERALRRGPDVAMKRGAQLPLTGECRELAQAILARPPKPVEAKGRTWRVGLSRLRAGENLNHADRFRLMMSMLRANWSDDQIQTDFAHAPNYHHGKTQGFIDHARRRYLQ